MLIIRDVFFGLRRFDQFQKDLGIARNVLSDRLKKLVDADVLEKSDGPGHPEYRLTEKGLALQPILLSMPHWGDTYYPHPDGKPIRKMAVYAADDRKIRTKDVKARRGPALESTKQIAPTISPTVQIESR